MTDSAQFDPWEHLQDTLRKVYKREVLQEFADIGDDDLANISTPRRSLKTACLPDDNDTTAMLTLRMLLFYIVLRRAQDLQAPIYGIPVGQAHETRRFKPQVCLYFREDPEDIEPGFYPLTAEINFRLMDETETSISKAELTSLANRIKSTFGGENRYKWHKGKTLCSYNDPENGYKLQIYAFSESVGKDVIEKVLSLQNKTPEWSKLTVNENGSPAEAYPVLPPTKTILGESLRMPRRRPVGYVRFNRATCAIWGKTKPVNLIDYTFRTYDNLVKP